MTATHLINRTPTKVLKSSSPYQVQYGEEPQYNHLRVFGSLCYTHLRSRDKDKFGSRSRKCIFVGYPFGQKGWKVYDVDKKEFLISRKESLKSRNAYGNFRMDSRGRIFLSRGLRIHFRVLIILSRGRIFFPAFSPHHLLTQMVLTQRHFFRNHCNYLIAGWKPRTEAILVY